MRYIAQVITHRDGAGVALQPLIAAGDSIMDVTGYPAPGSPSPDSLVWECWIADTTLAGIEAEPDHYVLWADEVIPDEG